jgi:hypothetical protein
MASPAVTGAGGFLSERRLRISASVAVVEGLLVIVGVIPRWSVFVVAIAAVAYWFFLGRKYKSLMVRQASWIFAASQVFVVLVPLFFGIFKTLAYIALAVLAVVALVFLFTERDQT